MYLIEVHEYKEAIEKGTVNSLDLDKEERAALNKHQKVLIKEVAAHKRVYLVVLEEYEWAGVFHKVDMSKLKKLFDATRIDAYAQSCDVCRKMASSEAGTIEEINKIVDDEHEKVPSGAIVSISNQLLKAIGIGLDLKN